MNFRTKKAENSTVRSNSNYLLVGLLFSALLSGTACETRIHEDLRRAAMKGDTDRVKAQLSRGANVNHRYGGWTILMFVARAGHTEVGNILLENGADPNAKSPDGTSALTIAAEYGHADIIKLLLAKGADVNLRNNHGNTALMYGAEYGHPQVVKVLIAAGADLNARDNDRETALIIAKRENQTEIIKLLTAAGATE